MDVRLSSVTDWLVYVGVRLFICLIQSFRLETCHRVARGLAWVVNDLVRVRGDVVDENLRHAYPQLSRQQRHDLAGKMWEHLTLMLCEIALASRKIHETNWRDHITIRDKKQVVAIFMDPRPTVAVTAHFGNFEMLGYIAGLLGFPTFTIARPLDNRFLDRFLSRHRGATGQYILSTQGSAEAAQQVLDAGETLALLGDQYAGVKGCWVEFFGRPASCHKALSLFALAGGVPLTVVYAKRTTAPLKFELGMAGTVDPTDENDSLGTVPELTQWYNRHLEDIISESPEQYWWVHRRWKDTRRARRRRKKKARIAAAGTGPQAPVSETSRGGDSQVA